MLMERQHIYYNQCIVEFQLAVSFEYADEDKLDCGAYNLGYKLCSSRVKILCLLC